MQITRQRKFRIWDNVGKRMIYPGSPEHDCSLIFHATGWQVLDAGLNKTVNHHYGILMEWTGAMDNQSRYIYEFDISRSNQMDIESPGEEKEVLYICVYIKEWCRYAWLDLEDEFFLYCINGLDALDYPSLNTYGIFQNQNKLYSVCSNLFTEKTHRVKLLADDILLRGDQFE